MATPPVFSVGQYNTAAYMNSIGMWKVATATMNGTATNIANCFTSDFLNYRVLINFTATTANQFVYLQFSNAGVPNGTLNYAYATNTATAAGAASTMSSPANTGLILGYVGTANPNSASSLDIYQPKVVGRTYGHSQRWEYDSANFVARSGGFLQDEILAFDGFTIGVGGGATIQGTINVYGYR